VVSHVCGVAKSVLTGIQFELMTRSIGISLKLAMENLRTSFEISGLSKAYRSECMVVYYVMLSAHGKAHVIECKRRRSAVVVAHV
jgi:hypothetical protein